MGMRQSMIVDIGDMPVRLSTADAGLLAMLELRYAGFVSGAASAVFDFDVSVVPQGSFDVEADLSVRSENGCWQIDRGDFHAEWDPRTRQGSIRQTRNPYAADSVLRIIHTLLLSDEGGFLLHAASAIRNGRAFLFTGRSGAGKTTIARLAPPDATLLTDEISYIRRTDGGFVAFGTPFAGELGTSGERVSAPIAAIYQLDQAPHNAITPLDPAQAVSALLQNVLFFTEDPDRTRQVFHAACNCAAAVPVQRLSFVPDTRVWDLIS
jgi:hypothetical protein